MLIESILIQSYPKKGGIKARFFFANLNAKKAYYSLESNRIIFDSLETYCFAFCSDLQKKRERHLKKR